MLFGGISLHYFGTSNTSELPTGPYTFDDTAPWISEATDVTLDSSGNFTQYLMANATFPSVAFNGTLNTNLLGAGAQFLPASGLPMLGNGMIDLQSLSNTTLLGYIYGGIIGTNDGNDDTAASGYIFDVYYTNTPTVIPEPATWAWVLGLSAGLLAFWRKRRGLAAA